MSDLGKGLLHRAIGAGLFALVMLVVTMIRHWDPLVWVPGLLVVAVAGLLIVLSEPAFREKRPRSKRKRRAAP